jgi:hypothetical protein
VSLDVDAAPPGTPGELRVLGGRESTWDSPLYLTSFSSTTVRAGMLMPRARVSVANTARMRPAVNSSSTISRKVGSMPAWWAAKPREMPSTKSQ